MHFFHSEEAVEKQRSADQSISSVASQLLNYEKCNAELDARLIISRHDHGQCQLIQDISEGILFSNGYLDFLTTITPIDKRDLRAFDLYDGFVAGQLAQEMTILSNEPDESSAWNFISNSSNEQQLLVKTIKDSEWQIIFRRLQSEASGFVTSTTLPPPQGQNMRLYGSDTDYGVGLMFHTDLIPKHDMEKAYAWPSGYFAKSEFNIDRTTGKLLNDRAQHLVSIADLREQNLQYQQPKFVFQGREIDRMAVPFNEILVSINLDAVVGLLVRSMEYQQLMYAMGVREKFKELFHIQLPIIIWDPQSFVGNKLSNNIGLRLLNRAHQRQILERYIRRMHCFQQTPFKIDNDNVIDISELCSHMHAEEQILFHASYGTKRELLFKAYQSSQNNVPPECTGSLCEAQEEAIRKFQILIAVGLYAATYASNVAAMEEIVKIASPIVLYNSSVYVAETVHWLCRDVYSAPMLIMYGALKVIGSVATGVTYGRLTEATDVLQQWIKKANSLYFRIDSWRKLKQAGKETGLLTFMTGKAIANRRNFCNALTCLAQCAEKGLYLMTLGRIIENLHKPCLRLELLQYILGLDARWTLQMVLASCRTAFQFV